MSIDGRKAGIERERGDLRRNWRERQRIKGNLVTSGERQANNIDNSAITIITPMISFEVANAAGEKKIIPLKQL